jgi:hypothetical protein
VGSIVSRLRKGIRERGRGRGKRMSWREWGKGLGSLEQSEYSGGKVLHPKFNRRRKPRVVSGINSGNHSHVLETEYLILASIF